MRDIKKPGINKILLRALLLYTPVFIISIATIMIFFSVYISLDMKSIAKSHTLILELQKKKTANNFREIFSDVQFLAESSILKKYCAKPNMYSKRINDQFLYFIKHKKLYEQIKLIDLKGDTLINAKSDLRGAVKNSPEFDYELDEYFSEYSILPENSIFISKLHNDNGHPVIHFFMPVFDSAGKKHSFLALTYIAQPLLNSFKDHESLSHGLITLVDKDSKWLLNPQPYEGTKSFKLKYPEIWEQIYLKEHGEAKAPSGLFYFTTLRPVPTLASEESSVIDLRLSNELQYHPSGYEWKLITFIPNQFFEARYGRMSTFTYSVFIVVNIGFIIACIAISAIWLRSKYRDEVAKLTQDEYVAELKMKRKKLQELVTDSQELVQILCHDLLNPLSAIKAIYDINLDTPEGKAIAQESLDESIDIITTVRTMRALESGKKQLELVPVNLLNSVEKSIRIINHRIASKGVTINTHIPSGISVIADKTSLVSSVIINLITNAVKFSSEGDSVDLTAEKNNGNIVLRISDTGIGMPQALIDNIFDPAKPTSRMGTSGEKGTGFGMPLVQKFMQIYGGSIEITSKEKTKETSDHGTTVKLTFKSAE